MKPTIFGLILAVLAYIYFQGLKGIIVGGAFFMIGLCVAFLSSEDKKMKARKTSCGCNKKEETVEEKQEEVSKKEDK